MYTALQPPKGSCFRIDSKDGATKIHWRPSRSWTCLPAALFLLFWLCGWTAGFFGACARVLNGQGGTFLLFWLGGWTLGGVMAIAMLWRLLRPVVPESVCSDHRRIEYDSGIPPFDPIGLRTSYANNSSRQAFPKRRKFSFAIAESPKFVLERVGAEQRLWFDVGSQRVVVGELLTEPEREWLFALLNTWRGDAREELRQYAR